MNKKQKEVMQSQLDNEKRTLRELKQVYTQALKDCEKKIAELSARKDMENIQSIIYQKQYQQAIKGQLEGILENLHSNEYATVSDYLARCYEDGYIGVMYDLQGQGIPLIVPIDQEQVSQAIQTDSKLSKPLYDRMGEDVNKLKRSIRAEVSRGIANGSSWNEVAGKLALSFINTPFHKAYNNAMRITRTEGHRIQVQAADHAQHKAKEKGADIVKQWDASLDKRTRDSHAKVDGELRDIDEKFSNGLMYPGDSKAPASEVVNCRCALLQRAKWALDESELDTLKERAKYFGLNKAENFADFKEKYLKAVENNVKSSKITIDESIIFKNAEKGDYSRLCKQHSKNVSKEDVAQIANHKKVDGSPGGYVATHNYCTINSNMRNDGFAGNKLDEDDYKTIEAMRKAISENTLDDDYYLTRYVNADYLTAVFGVKYAPRENEDEQVIDNFIVKAANLKKFIPKITEDMQSWVGKVITEDAFVSTSFLDDKNIMKDKPVMLLIEAPKGTNCYIPKNRKESECILGDKTDLYIRSIEFNPIDNKWIINARYYRGD